MLIKEFRIVMPLSLEEYRTGQIYATIEASKNETGGGEGIEILRNESFDNEIVGGYRTSGQYTYKIYHLETKAPTLIKLIFPKAAMQLHEESWNAYPYCKTVLKNPGYMKDDFILSIESIHLTGNTNEGNVHSLPEDKLKMREVIRIDITDPVESCDYKESEDPTKFKSIKTGRGPLKNGSWMNETSPLMTCYKLVTVDCKWFGLQRRIERIIQNSEHRLLRVFHRQLFCWMDRWHNLSLDTLRRIEADAEVELRNQISEGPVRGMQGSASVTDDKGEIRTDSVSSNRSSVGTSFQN